MKFQFLYLSIDDEGNISCWDTDGVRARGAQVHESLIDLRLTPEQRLDLMEAQLNAVERVGGMGDGL